MKQRGRRGNINNEKLKTKMGIIKKRVILMMKQMEKERIIVCDANVRNNKGVVTLTRKKRCGNEVEK